MTTKAFPATHTEFYNEFDPWRKEQIRENSPHGGTYVLKAKKPIGRLLNEDSEGILYIGKGDLLSNQPRVGKFINSLNKTETLHDGGNRFNVGHIIIKYPLDESIIEITLTDNPEQLESQKLNKYYLTFGELPPFNRRTENVK
jgi:hypothetical protein